MLDYLRYEISRATTADLQRAAEFLEGARQIRQVVANNGMRLVSLRRRVGENMSMTPLLGNTTASIFLSNYRRNGDSPRQ